jgi:hypothetical protein
MYRDIEEDEIQYKNEKKLEHMLLLVSTDLNTYIINLSLPASSSAVIHGVNLRCPARPASVPD